MPNFIGIDITGIETIKQRLKKLPREAQDAGVEKSNYYILKSMQIYPPPQTSYKRTQTLREGWKPIGTGYTQIIANEVPYAVYVQGDYQVKFHKEHGWLTAAQVIEKRAKEILKQFDAGVKKAIKKLGLA